MSDTPDPLGKRALFWAPAQRQEAGPLRPGKRVLPGRHALFSGGDPTAPSVAPKKNGAARTPLGTASRPTFADRPARPRKVTAKVETVAPGRGDGGPISLSCSKCGTHTDVDVLKYLVLHLPYWVWRPGRGYTSLMKCPACGKRTWVSASWAPRQR